MNRHGRPLSSMELISKLSEGGWIVSGGHQVRQVSFPKFPVVKAVLLGETLRIEVDGRNFDVPSDNIVLTDPWTVEIRYTFMRSQQRKKIEGGGWHEVPAMGVALRMSNPTFEENTRKDCEAEKQRNKEEQARRETEELNVRREQFITSINAGFAGKKLVKIEVVDEWKLRLLFEDSSTIEIGSEICDCYYAGGSAVVNGTSLQGYYRPEFIS